MTGTEHADGIDQVRRERYARTVLDNVTREYPHKPGYVIEGPDDLVAPHRVHPAFYGSYDWHSSVHGHWSLIRLLRAGLTAELADEVRRVLEAHLSEPRLEAERSFLASNPLFERPYGWAWALALVSEVESWAPAHGSVAIASLRRLAGTVSGLLVDHLTTTRYPVRSGTHSSTAFAMILAHHDAEFRGGAQLRETIERRAMEWFAEDVQAPVELEPSGEDFLSPTLTTAHLMARVLGADDLNAWIDRVLPGLRQGAELPLSSIPEVGDPSDAKLVHLRGLALSRAWNWRALATALPSEDRRRGAMRAAASGLIDATLPHVVSGEYGGDHWLVTFALLAEQGLGRSGQGTPSRAYPSPSSLRSVRGSAEP